MKTNIQHIKTYGMYENSALREIYSYNTYFLKNKKECKSIT